MARRYDDDDEGRPGGFWRFVRGVILGLIVSAAAVTVLSVYVLPPPVIPEPEPVADTGPVIVDGIEVSEEPAYSQTGEGDSDAPTGSDDAASGGTETASDPQSASTGDAAESPVPGEPDPQMPEGPAVVANAASFAGDLQRPLVAVVLDDTAAQPLMHELLFSLEMPLTIGVVAGGGGDRETAQAARDAGFEVVAQLAVSAPGASDGSTLEYELTEADAALRTLTLIQRVPVAVAVARTVAAPSPLDPGVLRGVASVIGPLGYAYVDVDVGPEGSTAGIAAAEGALVEVSRHTISASASAAEAHAILEEASAEAVEAGSAIVVAAPSEPLLQAMLLWSGASEGSLADLAPLTAVIRKKISGQ